MQLRPYQSQAIAEIREAWSKLNRVLLCAPTGSGKTHIFSYILSRAKVPALMVVRGRGLVNQASRRLKHEKIEHGVLMAGHEDHAAKVQVASIDTLIERKLKPEAKIIVIDEAHLATSQGYATFLNQYGPDTVILGVTASPWNPDGLDFETVIKPTTMLELIKDGYLVPPRYFCPATPNLKGVRVEGGDYNLAQLARAMDKGDLIGNIVKHWVAFGENRPSLGFATNVQHSKHIVERFNSEGIPARHIDADTPDEERNDAFEALRTGTLQVVFNVNVASVGLDVPWVSCLIMARPTQSYNLYIQQAGRGTRPYGAFKKDFIILDHASNVRRHGLITDEPEAVLGRGLKVKVQGGTKISQCPKCYSIFKSGTVCPECGAMAPEIKLEKSGVLKEVKVLSEEEQYLIHLKRERALRRKPDGTKYKAGWVFYQFKQRFGEEAAAKYIKKRVVPEWIKARL